MQSKLALRNLNKAKRQALSQREQLAAAHQMTRRLLQASFFKMSQKIAFYAAIRGEMSLEFAINAAARQGKACYLPALDLFKKNHLCFLPYSSLKSVKKNQYGIIEPWFGQHAPLLAHQLDLILMPLVAFDDMGQRLGMGAGYYDRTLAFIKKTAAKPKPLLIGIAYEWQQCAQLPAEPHDIPLDGVVTDTTIYFFKNPY